MLSLEVKNEKGVWFNSLSNRGIVGWLLALFLSFGYITLYFFLNGWVLDKKECQILDSSPGLIR